MRRWHIFHMEYMELFANPYTKMKNKKKRENVSGQDDLFFDDCPICQAMKAAQERGRELSLDELKEVFQKAKDQGGVVGGEWFDKK